MDVLPDLCPAPYYPAIAGVCRYLNASDIFPGAGGITVYQASVVFAATLGELSAFEFCAPSRNSVCGE